MVYTRKPFSDHSIHIVGRKMVLCQLASTNSGPFGLSPLLSKVIVFVKCCTFEKVFHVVFLIRSVIYSLSIVSGRGMPISSMMAAFTFCIINGFLQSHTILYVVSFHKYEHQSVTFIIGTDYLISIPLHFHFVAIRITCLSV